jgi:protein-tyrosine phosphatase
MCAQAAHEAGSCVDLPDGPIDVHCHVLPGIDDGCETVEQSIESVLMLKNAGFAGSVCTPHIWPVLFPSNTIAHVAAWTEQLGKQLGARGIDYRLWPGGELRLFDGVIGWMKSHGVPTLASSRCVLVDFWEMSWPRWVDTAFDWLLAEGYQPILAHPERLSILDILPGKLEEIAGKGVLLQGNFRCMTGEDGYLADVQIRQWLAEDRYALLALDSHRPDDLPCRLDGMAMVAQEFGAERLKRCTIDTPRRLIFGR